MTSHCDNPWFFHRDEIDLLEEEIDEIFRGFHAEGSSSLSDMEDRVLQEQIQTEELFDADLSLEQVTDLLFSETQKEEDHQMFHGSLKEVLRQQSARDPLYEQVYLWTKRVFAFTTETYFKDGVKDEALFRAHVNVNMIPIKLAGMMTEKMSQKDSQFCLIYFARTLDSLQHRAFLGDEHAQILETEGRELERLIRLHFV